MVWRPASATEGAVTEAASGPPQRAAGHRAFYSSSSMYTAPGIGLCRYGGMRLNPSDS